MSIKGKLILKRTSIGSSSRPRPQPYCREWIGEAKEEYISEVFRVGPGDIRRVAEAAEWLMHSLAELSKHLELGVTYSAGQLAERIHYGAGPDLLTLLNLKGVGRVRARKLYQAGYTSMPKLKAADLSDVGKILGPKVAEKILAQLSIGIDNP